MDSWCLILREFYQKYEHKNTELDPSYLNLKRKKHLDNLKQNIVFYKSGIKIIINKVCGRGTFLYYNYLGTLLHRLKIYSYFELCTFLWKKIMFCISP